MAFVDKLKEMEKEPYNPPKTPLSQEEIERQNRHQYIMSGEFSKFIIDKLKKNLLEEAENSRAYGFPIEKNHYFRCIYQEKAFRIKERKYQEEYNDFDNTPSNRIERKKKFLEYYLPHCVFDKEEKNCLKEQLQKELVADGFRVVFDIEEFKYKLCSGFGLGVERKSYGYTINFTVYW